MARRNPTARAGNYVAPVDTSGMDESMKESLGVRRSQKMDKVESGYVTARGKNPSAVEAVRRTRKANRKPPIPEE